MLKLIIIFIISFNIFANQIDHQNHNQDENPKSLIARIAAGEVIEEELLNLKHDLQVKMNSLMTSSEDLALQARALELKAEITMYYHTISMWISHHGKTDQEFIDHQHEKFDLYFSKNVLTDISKFMLFGDFFGPRSHFKSYEQGDKLYLTHKLEFLDGLYMGAKYEDGDEENFHALSKYFIRALIAENVFDPYDYQNRPYKLGSAKNYEQVLQEKRKSEIHGLIHFNIIKTFQEVSGIPQQFKALEQDEAQKVLNMLATTQLLDVELSTESLVREILSIGSPDKSFSLAQVTRMVYQFRYFEYLNIYPEMAALIPFNANYEVKADKLKELFIYSRVYSLFGMIAKFSIFRDEGKLTRIWQILSDRAKELSENLPQTPFHNWYLAAKQSIKVEINQYDAAKLSQVHQGAKDFKAIEDLISIADMKISKCNSYSSLARFSCQMSNDNKRKKKNKILSEIDRVEFKISDIVEAKVRNQLGIEKSNNPLLGILIESNKGVELDGLRKNLSVFKEAMDKKKALPDFVKGVNQTYDDILNTYSVVIDEVESTFFNHLENKKLLWEKLSAYEREYLLSKQRLELLAKFPFFSFEKDDSEFYEILANKKIINRRDFNHLRDQLVQIENDEEQIDEIASRFPFYSAKFTEFVKSHPAMAKIFFEKMDEKTKLGAYEYYRQNIFHYYVGTGFLSMIGLHLTRWASKFYRPMHFMTPALNEINKRLSPYLTGFTISAMSLIFIDTGIEAWIHVNNDVPFYDGTEMLYFGGLVTPMLTDKEYFTLQKEFTEKKTERYFSWVIDGLFLGLIGAAQLMRVKSIRESQTLKNMTLFFVKRRYQKTEQMFKTLGFKHETFSWSPEIIREMYRLQKVELTSAYIARLEEIKGSVNFSKELSELIQLYRNSSLSLAQKYQLSDELIILMKDKHTLKAIQDVQQSLAKAHSGYLQEVKELDNAKDGLFKMLQKEIVKWERNSVRLKKDFNKFGLKAGDWNLPLLDARFNEIKAAYEAKEMSQELFYAYKLSYDEITSAIASTRLYLEIEMFKEFYAYIFSKSLRYDDLTSPLTTRVGQYFSQFKNPQEKKQSLYQYIFHGNKGKKEARELYENIPKDLIKATEERLGIKRQSFEYKSEDGETFIWEYMVRKEAM